MPLKINEATKTHTVSQPNKPHTEAGTPKAKEPVTFISNVHVVEDGNKGRNRHFAW